MAGGKYGKKLQKQVAFDKTTCFCCPLLPEKMQPESVAAQWIPGFSKEIVKFPLAALVQIFPR